MRSLEEENQRLRKENLLLQERLRQVEETHKKEMSYLSEKMENLFFQTTELEHKIQADDREWNKYAH